LPQETHRSQRDTGEGLRRSRARRGFHGGKKINGRGVVSRRWVVERTFGWLLRYRRLVREHERRIEHHEAMV
jgi:transposase